MRGRDGAPPVFSRELIRYLRLLSLGVGIVILVLGSVCLPSTDWDVPICFVMGVPAYVLAPWAFRQLYYLRIRWWPLAAGAFWLSVDGAYWLYWGIRDPALAEIFRPANFFYCTPIFWLAGFVWNLDSEGDVSMAFLAHRAFDPFGSATAEWGAAHPVRRTYDTRGRRPSSDGLTAEHERAREPFGTRKAWRAVRPRRTWNGFVSAEGGFGVFSGKGPRCAFAQPPLRARAATE